MLSIRDRVILFLLVIIVILGIIVIGLASKIGISFETVKIVGWTMWIAVILLFIYFLAMMWLTVSYKRRVFPVEINYSLSFEEMVECGKYPGVGHGINEKDFPIQGEGKVKHNLLLVNFPFQCWFRWIYPLDKDAILKQLKQKNFIPAKIEDLIFFSVLYQKECKKFTIAALGHDKICYLQPSWWGSQGGLVDWGVFDYWKRGRNRDLRFLVYRET